MKRKHEPRPSKPGAVVGGRNRSARSSAWIEHRPSKSGVPSSNLGGRTVPTPRLTPVARFHLFVDARDKKSCWPWLGSRNDAGYGSFYLNNRRVMAHRAAFGFAYGPLTPGVVIRHACNNAWCVNPRHLRAGTQADNMRDKVVAGRQAKGSKNGRAKLTEKTAREALRRMAKGERKTDLALELGVSRRALRFLESGAKWKHVHAAPVQMEVLRGLPL